jgi:hypothetical protein
MIIHAQFADAMLSKLVHATGTDFTAAAVPDVADVTVMDGVSTSLTVTSIFLAPACGSIFSDEVATRASCGACARSELPAAAKTPSRMAMKRPRLAR